MRRTTFVGLVPLLLLLVTGEATAHAFLDHAEPRVGNISTITVTNAAGQRVDTGKTRVSGNQMAISLRAGGAGTYHVTWRVLSVDTHTSDGNFTFQVGP